MCRTEVTVQRESQPLPLPSPSFSHPVTHGKEDTFEQGKLETPIKQASQTLSRNITLSLFRLCFPLRKKGSIVIATHMGYCIAASKDIERNPKK